MLQQVFNYNGNGITFHKDGNVFVNATEMAKTFGKRPVDWLSNSQTSEYLNELTKVRKSTLTDLVIVTKGGSNPGTWMHEDVALEFARWLSPAFAIWCNDHIKQMLTTGHTSMGSLNEDQEILRAMQLLQNRVETTKKQLELANTTIKTQAPKVEYYDEVLDSEGLISTTIIAKDLGMSANALNRKLHMMGIIFPQNGTWVPYSKYQGNGLSKSKTFPYQDKDGRQKTAIHFYWTEKGREFIMSKITKPVNA